MRVKPPHPVGIDIERIRPIDPRLPARAFHPAEAAWLQSLPPASRLDAFFQLWTAKESYAKALGLGLALDPKACRVDPVRRTIQRAEPGPVPPPPWHWRTRLLAGCYRLSLCTPRAEVESLALVDPQRLIANT